MALFKVEYLQGALKSCRVRSKAQRQHQAQQHNDVVGRRAAIARVLSQMGERRQQPKGARGTISYVRLSFPTELATT